MCLAVPARVDERNGDDGWVTLGDARVRVNLCITPDAGVGDWVLVHAGFAIQHIDEAAARETWQLIEELDRARRDEDEGTGRGSGAGGPHDPTAEGIR